MRRVPVLPPEEDPKLSELRGWFDAVSDFYENKYGFPLAAEFESDETFLKQANAIALLLSNGEPGVIGAAPDHENMVVEFIYSHNGTEFVGCEIQHVLRWDGSLYLSKYLTPGELSDVRHTSGNDGAWGVVTALSRAFLSVRAEIVRLDSVARTAT